MAESLNIDLAAHHLFRDRRVTEAFLVNYGSRAELPNLAAVRAADEYGQWCEAARSQLLYADGPVDLKAFDQQWRLRAYASDIRSVSRWVEVLSLVFLLALIAGVLAAAMGNLIAAALWCAIVLGAGIYISSAELILLVGAPDVGTGGCTGKQVLTASNVARSEIAGPVAFSA